MIMAYNPSIRHPSLTFNLPTFHYYYSPCHPSPVLQSSTAFFTRYNRRGFQGIF